MSRNLIRNMFFNVLKRKKNKKKQFPSLFAYFGRVHALIEVMSLQCIDPTLFCSPQVLLVPAFYNGECCAHVDVA